MNIKITDIIHFVTGLVASILGLQLPITIIFTAYEVMDAWLKAKASEITALKESKEYTVAWIENIQDIIHNKFELRRDLGLFILGLIAGKMF